MKKVVGPLLGSCRILTEKLAVEKDPEAAQQTTDLLMYVLLYIKHLVSNVDQKR